MDSALLSGIMRHVWLLSFTARDVSFTFRGASAGWMSKFCAPAKTRKDSSQETDDVLRWPWLPVAFGPCHIRDIRRRIAFSRSSAPASYGPSDNGQPRGNRLSSSTGTYPRRFFRKTDDFYSYIGTVTVQHSHVTDKKIQIVQQRASLHMEPDSRFVETDHEVSFRELPVQLDQLLIGSFIPVLG